MALPFTITVMALHNKINSLYFVNDLDMYFIGIDIAGAISSISHVIASKHMNHGLNDHMYIFFF